MYIELHASSAFSFLDGASLPEALVERAVELGYPALALLDRDGVYGAPRFHLAAKRAGIKAIIGAELTVADRLAARQDTASRAVRRAATARRGRHARTRLFTLPVLIESRDGYRNLCRLVTTMKLRAAKGEGALTFDDLDGHIDGLIALAGRTAIDGARFGVGGLVDRIVGTFGAPQVYVELQRHLLREQEWDNQVAARARRGVSPAGDRHQRRSLRGAVDRPLYDVLTCIRHKTTLERAGRRLSCNAERYLKSPEAMARLFADDAARRSRDRRARRAPRLHDGRSRLSLSRVSGAARRDDGIVPAEDHAGGRARAVSAVRRSRAPPDRARARSDREARSRRLLPDRLGHRQLLPPARHPGAGARLGGQQRRLLQPRASPRSIRSAWSCCSSGFSPRSAANGRTSISICRAATGASR